MHTPRPTAGFTLIELLMVIAIIAIVFMISLPNWGTNMARQRMLAASAEMMTSIRNAQSNVLTGEVHGQQVRSALSVELLNDPDTNAYGMMTVFINRDGETPERLFFDEYDGTRGCSPILPHGLCASVCTSCIGDPSNCPIGMTETTCRDIMRRDHLVDAIGLGSLAMDRDREGVTFGKIRVLGNGNPTDPNSTVSQIENPVRTLIRFEAPRGELQLYAQQSITNENGGNPAIQEDFFTLCMEVRSRIGGPTVSSYLSRVLVLHKMGGYVREYAQWPAQHCGDY